MNLDAIINYKKKIFSYSQNPQPNCTTYIKSSGLCQFCESPSGNTCCHDFNDQHRFGFISCSKEECNNSAKNKIEDFFSNAGWDKIKDIINSGSFKIKRSSGIIEDDWKFIYKTFDASMGALLRVGNDQYNKFVKFSDFIEWNS